MRDYEGELRDVAIKNSQRDGTSLSTALIELIGDGISLAKKEGLNITEILSQVLSAEDWQMILSNK
jgi:hypothetical protein